MKTVPHVTYRLTCRMLNLVERYNRDRADSKQLHINQVSSFPAPPNGMDQLFSERVKLRNLV